MKLYSIIDCSEQALASLAYILKNSKEKLAGYRNYLTFLIRCRNNQVIPKCLRVSVSVESTKAKLIAQKSSQALVRERIKFTRKIVITLKRAITEAEQQIFSLIKNNQQIQQLICWSVEDVKRIFRETKQSQQAKFNKLLGTRPRTPAMDKSCLL